jgi:hypothetical protein
MARIDVEIVKLTIVAQPLRSGEHGVREGTSIGHVRQPSRRRRAVFDDRSTWDVTARKCLLACHPQQSPAAPSGPVPADLHVGTLERPSDGRMTAGTLLHRLGDGRDPRLVAGVHASISPIFVTAPSCLHGIASGRATRPRCAPAPLCQVAMTILPRHLARRERCHNLARLCSFDGSSGASQRRSGTLPCLPV